MGQLKRNITYNFIYQILILILPFITAPYLSRKIGATGVGVYSFSQTVATYFTFITLLGLANYGNRAIAVVQNDKKKRSEVFSEIYCMQVTCFFASIVLYVIYINLFSVDKTASLIMSIWIISALFDISWLFFGLEQFKLIVVRNSIIKILSVICIFVFVRSVDDIYKYIVIMAVSTLISQLFLWSYVKKFVDFKTPKYNNIIKHFKPNLVLFLPVISVSLYRMMDKIMLGYLCSMSEVGFYENAEKIINMVQSLIVAVGTVMLPRMSALYSNNDSVEGNKYFGISMKAVLVYIAAATFGLVSIASLFTDVYYGAGFERTAEILVLLSVTLIFFGTGNVLRTQHIIPMKKDDIYIKSAFGGAVVNIIVNTLLIGKYGGIGAAIGTICAEAFVCAYQFFRVRQEIRISEYFFYALKYGLCGFIMFVFVRLVPPLNNEILSLLLKIGVGCFVYSLLVGMDLYISKSRCFSR